MNFICIISLVYTFIINLRWPANKSIRLILSVFIKLVNSKKILSPNQSIFINFWLLIPNLTFSFLRRFFTISSFFEFKKNCISVFSSEKRTKLFVSFKKNHRNLSTCSGGFRHIVKKKSLKFSDFF